MRNINLLPVAALLVFIAPVGTSAQCPVTPAITISASSATFCSGVPVAFTATTLNGGSAPVLQWKKNNTDVGANDSTYTDAALASGDVIICVLTSNAACATQPSATSNAISLSQAVAGNCPPAVYTFTGSGNWSAAQQWNSGLAPPATITQPSSVIIKPANSGQCVVDIPVTIPQGSSVMVKAGKKLQVNGNLTIAGGEVTRTITADKDNTMYSENSNSNGAGSNLFAGQTSGGNRRRALLHFNLSSIPAGATVTAVTLNLYNNKQAFSAAGITIYKATADWGEGTSHGLGAEGQGAAATTGDATWATRMYPSTFWTTPGGDFVTTPTITADTIVSGVNALAGANFITDVQSFVANAATNFGWVITGSAEGTDNTTLRFGSKDNSDAAQRPTLTVTYR